MRISVVGHLTIDEVVFYDGTTRIGPGGPAYYSSITLRVMGAEVKVYSVVGGDYPEEYLRDLAGIGIDVDGVVRAPSSRSTKYRIRYSAGGRRIMQLLGRAPNIPLGELAEPDAVYLGPVAWELQLDDLSRLNKRFKTLLDPQGMMRNVDASGTVVLEGRIGPEDLRDTWIVRLSLEESEVLTGAADPVGAAELLLRQGVGAVVLSMGERGLISANSRERYLVPSYPGVKVVDPTGAGDVLGAALLIEYLRTGDLLWSSAVGASAASIAIEDYGASSILSGDFDRKLRERAGEIIERVKRL